VAFYEPRVLHTTAGVQTCMSLRLACLRKSADYKRLIDTVFVVLADIFDTVRIEDIVYILTILISPVYLVKI